MKSPELHTPEWITAREVEQITSIKVGTLGQWRCKGKEDLPFYKLPSGSIKYDRRDVIAYMLKSKRSPSVRAHMEEIAHGGV